MNNLRKLYYYFGRDEKYNYIATPMQSALIVGRCGSGKSVLLKSLLVKLIQECSPAMLDIRLHGVKGVETAMWSELIPEGRRIPHISQIVNYAVGYNLSDPVKDAQFQHDTGVLMAELRDLVQTVKDRETVCREMGLQDYSSVMSDGDSDEKCILLIIDDYELMSEDFEVGEQFDEAVSFIASRSSVSCVYVMLLGNRLSEGLKKDSAMYSFRIRAAVPTDEDTSNLMLGNNCAAKEYEKYGVVWVKDFNNYPIRLYVPFYPDTWIRKFIGYSSVRGGYVTKGRFDGDHEHLYDEDGVPVHG